MRRKTLRERQQKKAMREARRQGRQKARDAQHQWDNNPAHMANADETAMDMEQETDEIDKTFSAIEDIAEKLGIEAPLAEEPVEEAEEPAKIPAQEEVVELSAFDHFRKRNKDGYQSRDNGRLFKLYNVNLLLRIVLFVLVLVFVIRDHDAIVNAIYANPLDGFNWLMVLWGLMVLTILLRFVPGPVSNPGYQKQFLRHFAASSDFDEENIRIKRTIKRANRGAWKVLGCWALLNALIGILYWLGILDEAGLLLIALLYAIGDVVCILYYCPFQHLLMKNRCCMTCRIYNWDFFMICTPLLFIPSWLTWSLVAISLLVLIRWEYIYKHHPERFFGATNGKLRCVSCASKLCRYKFPATATAKQLFNRK